MRWVTRLKPIKRNRKNISIALVTMFGGRGGAPKAIRRLYNDLSCNYKMDIDLFLYDIKPDRSIRYQTPTRVAWGGSKSGLIARAESYFLGKLASFINKIVFSFRLMESRQFFLEGRLLAIKDFDRYEVVILSWWQLLANTSDLSQREGKIVYILHDMWAITGGCSYSRGCLEFSSGCQSCPAMRAPFKTLVRSNAEKKIRLLNKPNSYVMVTSDWMRTMCLKAGVHEERLHLLQNYYPEDTFSFRELRRDSCLELYFVGDIDDSRKGFSILVEALRLLDEETIRRIRLKILGCSHTELEKRFHSLESLEVTCLGISYSEIDQARYYNQADWLICPSMQDNSPNTIGEAHMCGLPVVTIKGTGSAEMISSGVNGLIVDDADLVFSLSQTIERLERVTEDNRRKISIEARSRYTSKALAEILRVAS